MKIVRSIAELHDLRTAWRREQQSIALVPTMGNLHDGHLALAQQAKQSADRTIVYIFVNPHQFGPKEDFTHYPRTLEADISKLKPLNIDAVFIPDVKEIYPDGEMQVTRVAVPGLSDDLCGITRPQLFYGVATILSKFFNIVAPDIALFGEKDYQQLVIVKQMVKDLNFPIAIHSGKTVRETDGLAMSSRNGYLSEAERKIAPKLYALSQWARAQILAGNQDYESLCAQAKLQLQHYGFGPIDYFTVREKETLQVPSQATAKENLIILVAAFLGTTRLIDNLPV